MGSNSPVTVQRMVAIVIFLLLYAPKADTAAAQAADFGFRFEVGDCLTERLDTFSGVFTKNLGGEPAQTVTVSDMSLSAAQMTAIYRAIENIRFFDYPSPFNGVPTGLQEVMETIPYNTYRLEVRNAGVVHTVVWKDAYKPTTAEADHLRDLFSMVLGFIHEHPEFKRLPRRIGGCESNTLHVANQHADIVRTTGPSGRDDAASTGAPSSARSSSPLAPTTAPHSASVSTMPRGHTRATR